MHHINQRGLSPLFFRLSKIHTQYPQNALPAPHFGLFKGFVF